MAIACLREVTFFPERPDLSFPRFISCMARLTFLPAFEPFFFADLFLVPMVLPYSLNRIVKVKRLPAHERRHSVSRRQRSRRETGLRRKAAVSAGLNIPQRVRLSVAIGPCTPIGAAPTLRLEEIQRKLY